MSADLDQRMRAILTQLELVSHGTIAGYNSAGGGGGDLVDPTPKGASGSEHLYWRQRYGPPFAPESPISAKNDHDRIEIIGHAEAELQRLRGHGIDRSRVVGETQEQEDERIIKDGAGFTADEVAVRFRCTPTRVRRVRLAEGRRVEDGHKPEASKATDMQSEARRMKANGMSVRQIAMTLGKHATTIQRLLAQKT